jgi:hypothetical protein
VTKVGKSDGEATFTETCGSDGDAPIAVIRRPMLIFQIDNLWWPVSITV